MTLVVDTVKPMSLEITSVALVIYAILKTDFILSLMFGWGYFCILFPSLDALQDMTILTSP